MKSIFAVFIVVLLVGACSTPISKEAKQDMAAPVDCSTGTQDIATLTAEKAKVSKEIEDGATSIIPIGLVVHLFKRDEKDSFKVGFGEYNRALDKKIADIKFECNIE